LADPGFKVRAFDIKDLERVMHINSVCLPENYSSYFYRDLYQRYPETFRVAEADGTVQGYIMCRIERGWSKIGKLTPARLCQHGRGGCLGHGRRSRRFLGTVIYRPTPACSDHRCK